MHQLFTTQIYQNKIKFDLKDLSKEIWQIVDADKEGHVWSQKNYVNGFTSYGSWDQLHKMSSTFETLEKKIDKHVAAYIKKLEFDIDPKSLQMNSFWVNVMPMGSLHTAHIHPQSVISGTFYVDAPANSGSIKFEDPRLGFFMNTPPVKQVCQKYNQRFFSIQPKAGDVVLFESWLKHEVMINKAKKPRISVSFNYGWC